MDITPSLQIIQPAGYEPVRPLSSLSHLSPANPAHHTSPNRYRALKTLFSAALIYCLIAAVAGPATAQSFSGFGDVDATGTSYHRFVRPGEATVEVVLLSNTAASGIYVIGLETDLAEFLALSGLAFGSASGREKTSVTIRLYRQLGTNREIVFEAPIEDVLSAAANVPVFADGDIIYVETRSRTRLSWIEIIRSASGIATLVFVAERLINAIR